MFTAEQSASGFQTRLFGQLLIWQTILYPRYLQSSCDQ